MAKGEYDTRSKRIGFDKWNLDTMEEVGDLFSDLFRRVLEEGLKFAAAEYECEAYFPIEWAFGDDPEDGVGGPSPTDPTTIYVTLPLGVDDDEGPRWKFTLSDLVDDAIRGWQVGEKIGDEHKPNALAIRDSLRALADKIDGYC